MLFLISRLTLILETPYFLLRRGTGTSATLFPAMMNLEMISAFISKLSLEIVMSSRALFPVKPEDRTDSRYLFPEKRRLPGIHGFT